MKNWGRKKIVDISTVFEDGDWIESKDQSAEGIRLIQTGNVGNGIFKDRGEKARYISEDTFKKLRCTEIFEGDCLVSRLPDPVGRACILPDTGEKMITAVDCTIIRFDQKQLISNWFLYYSLSNEYQNEIQKQVTGATRQRISRKNLGLVSVPLPPLPEQQRIVSILDEAFAAIAKAKANAEQNLKNTAALFESYLQGVFERKRDGWEERKVKDIGFAQTGTTPKTAEKENYGDFIPFIKPADVDFSGIGDIRYDNEGLSEIGLKKGRKMENGSILMVCIGATIGKVGFAEREVSCNQQINSLTVKKEFEPKFIYYVMTSREFQGKVLLEGKGAQATLPIINKSKWENLTISFPKSKEEQQTIVRQLDALRAETQKLGAVYQKKIDDLEELKKSILQKAFAGELRSPERATYDSEAVTPLARDNDGHRPSKKKPSSITSPEGA
jgi:type I restriction enzyme S subunit